MQKRKGKHNGESLFGFKQIPSDNHIRQCLDQVDPNIALEFFKDITSELDQDE